MLATHCAVCARPLVDAKSVELGIGPDCRRKYGYDLACTDEARSEANRLVYRIAADQSGAQVAADCDALVALGFEKLAARIRDRVVAITIEESVSERGLPVLLVKAPYSETALGAWRQVRTYWHGASKRHAVDAGMRRNLFDLLKTYYPGAIGMGPKGSFVVGGAA
jgi:hypothetical protein